jgi:D-serine dehydratase
MATADEQSGLDWSKAKPDELASWMAELALSHMRLNSICQQLMVLFMEHATAFRLIDSQLQEFRKLRERLDEDFKSVSEQLDRIIEAGHERR